MLDANKSDIKQAGRREVVEWVKEHQPVPYELDIVILKGDWQQQLKKWGF